MTATSILASVNPCKKCGGTDRDNRKRCIPCEKERLAKSYQDNKERIADSQRARIAKDPEKRRAITARYAEKNRKELTRKQAIYNKKNKEKLDAARRLWLTNNKDKAAATRAKWIAENKEVRASYNHTRRAMKLASGGKLSTGIVKRLFVLQKGLCPCCGDKLGGNYHLDHITPLYLGGANTDDNVQLLKAGCNLKKSTKHPIDFMQERGFLL